MPVTPKIDPTISACRDQPPRRKREGSSVLRIDVARVRVEGKVTVEDLVLDIEVEAALVT